MNLTSLLNHYSFFYTYTYFELVAEPIHTICSTSIDSFFSMKLLFNSLSLFELFVAYYFFITKLYHLPHQLSYSPDGIAALLGKAELQQITWLHSSIVHVCMHASCIVFTIYIQSSTITFSSETTITRIPSQLYLLYIFVKEKKMSLYCKLQKFNLSLSTQDFQEGWSVMKWVWSPWNCS